MNCPICKTEIKPEDINIQKDIAKCYFCHHLFAISDTIVSKNASRQAKFDVYQMPKGTWYRDNYDMTVVGATTRHPIAFFIVPFMLVWSGGSIGGIYGSQILSGEFNPVMCLFGIPFLVGSIIFWSVALMTICGKVEIKFNHENAKIFTGVGKIGLSKSFSWKDIDTIDETASKINYPGGQGAQISLNGQRRITFASGLNDERRYYIMQVLKEHLYKIKR